MSEVFADRHTCSLLINALQNNKRRRWYLVYDDIDRKIMLGANNNSLNIGRIAEVEFDDVDFEEFEETEEEYFRVILRKGGCDVCWFWLTIRENPPKGSWQWRQNKPTAEVNTNV